MKYYNVILIFILGCLAAISPLSIDIYLPGFINIASDFATTIDSVSSSLSAFFNWCCCLPAILRPINRPLWEKATTDCRAYFLLHCFCWMYGFTKPKYVYFVSLSAGCWLLCCHGSTYGDYQGRFPTKRKCKSTVYNGFNFGCFANFRTINWKLYFGS